MCSVAADASHDQPRVAGEAAGTNAEAAPGTDPGRLQPLGLRQQALEVDQHLL